MPLLHGRKPRYYQAVGSADNLAPNGLKHSGTVINQETRIPFAAHDPTPEPMANGSLPHFPKESRFMQPEKPPKETFSFSGRPISHAKYYSGK